MHYFGFYAAPWLSLHGIAIGWQQQQQQLNLVLKWVVMGQPFVGCSNGAMASFDAHQ